MTNEIHDRMKQIQESIVFPEEKNISFKSQSKLQSYMHEKHVDITSEFVPYLFRFYYFFYYINFMSIGKTKEKL